MKNLKIIGETISRYGIAYILIAFGIYKFTATEAAAIKPLIDNSFFFNWSNNFFTIRTISKIIGVIEISAGIGIASRFYSPKLALYGSILGGVIFFVTLTFLFTTPGMIAKSEWLWLPDGFIIKDLALLGFCIWGAGEAYTAKKSYNLKTRPRKR